MLVEAQAVQLQQELVAHQIAARQVGAAQKRQAALTHDVGVLFQVEGVHEQVVTQMRDGAGAHSHALLVGHGVLVHLQVLAAAQILVEAVEGPQGAPLEEGRLSPVQNLV